MKIIALFLIIITAMLVFIFYAGGPINKIEITIDPVGPSSILYIEQVGSYRQARRMMDDLRMFLRDSLKINADTGFIILYDNPRRVASDSIRMAIGFLIDTLPLSTWFYKAGMLGSGSIESAKAIFGRYPNPGFFSYVAGVFRFYPKLDKYTSDNRLEIAGPVIEFYVLDTKTIYYAAPLKGELLILPPAP